MEEPVRGREPASFSAVQKWLHWTMAALIVLMVAVGLTMTRLGEGPVTNFLYELHKSVGLTLFALALVRILVRLARGAPALEPGVPRWHRIAAYTTHYALYVLIVLVPIVGWTATSSCCAPVNLFWTVPLTLPVPGDESFWKTVFPIHYALAFTLVGIALLHISGALQHHFVRRDRTLVRMLPGGHGERESQAR
jgi:cytochrome b561